MKMILFTLLLTGSWSILAIDYGYLTAKDQKYYKNDSMEGNNQRERVDSTVKEINKLYGELAAIKSEVESLKKDIEILKKSK